MPRPPRGARAMALLAACLFAAAGCDLETRATAPTPFVVPEGRYVLTHVGRASVPARVFAPPPWADYVVVVEEDTLVVAADGRFVWHVTVRDPEDREPRRITETGVITSTRSGLDGTVRVDRPELGVGRVASGTAYLSGATLWLAVRPPWPVAFQLFDFGFRRLP